MTAPRTVNLESTMPTEGCWRSVEYGQLVDHPCFVHTRLSIPCVEPFMLWAYRNRLLGAMFERALMGRALKTDGSRS